MSDVQLALSDICRAWPALLPPNLMTVSQGIARNMVIKRPGGAGGHWNPDETAYMVEPADMLASRRHAALCFCGPAQSGKTVALVDGWMAHNVVNDPGDMLITQMTQVKAREYSAGRIGRMIRASPELRALKTRASRDDNIFDKTFRNGMRVKFGWPTAANFASTSYKYAAGTDYDRWADDIDGEGDGFTQQGNRVRTFLSRGMNMVESSPGRPIKDPHYKLTGLHEAPPVGGVLGIYNLSDRRRWYWQCPHCQEHFEATPGLSLFHLPSDDELIESVRDLDIPTFARQHARVICPNGCIVLPALREGMNRGGVWLPEGVTIDAQRRRSGDPRQSSIVGYWLGGVAATYISWFALIEKHMNALLDYALTGSELTIQTTANTDQAVPYLSRAMAEAQRMASKGDLVEHDLPRFVVPDAARFILAAVDVQGGKNARFVVQVHAIGEHQEQWLIDRFDITESEREGMGSQFAPIDPASHPEDWDVLTKRVVNATYRTADENIELKVFRTIVDTGGEQGAQGVTNNAYAWARRLRRDGLLARVKIAKGANTKAEWHVRETQVGGTQGKGDLTLYLLEPNKLKDMVSNGLQRRVPGPNYYHLPAPKHPDRNPGGWLPASFFDELKAEVRDANGSWVQMKKRNEAFDCCYMIRGLCVILGVDKRDFWLSPPRWALPIGLNSEAITRELRREQQDSAPAPTPKPAQPREQRQIRRSSYMA